MKVFNVYNSLTNKIEPLKPIVENEISMYVCGPTVYGDIHIGNCRPVIVFDVLYRLLTYVGYKVSYMSNITLVRPETTIFPSGVTSTVEFFIG